MIKTNVYPLSNVQCVLFDYLKKETLKHETVSFDNGFSFKKYDLFDRLEDIAYSNKTLTALTNQKNLNSAFTSSSAEIKFGQIGGVFYLQDQTTGKYLTSAENGFYFTQINDAKEVLYAVKVEENIVNLYNKENKILQIQKNYPYDVVLSDTTIPNNERYRREFYVDYKPQTNILTLKVRISPTEFRFLSVTAEDQKLRAVGLILENSIYNDYYFTPTFITSPILLKGSNLQTKEVTYWNNFTADPLSRSLDLKAITNADTHHLITTTLYESSSSVPLNISSIKTNFTCNQTYNYEGTSI